jgi:hypothetical protein
LSIFTIRVFPRKFEVVIDSHDKRGIAMQNYKSKFMGATSQISHTIVDSIDQLCGVANDLERDGLLISDPEPEAFLTLIAIANRLGLPVFKIRRAAKQGLFPTYSLLNGRKLARLSEVEAAIERSRSGGINV